MAFHSTHLPPPSPAETPPLAPTTIRHLSDDLLREILLRLPSLPSLVRAALTCRAFLAAVRSSPFRRRFRALHPPPLLGFFFEPEGDEIPTFTPIRRGSDRDLMAAVRGLDAFLTRVPHQYDDDVFPGWKIMECRGGCLLLFNWRTEQLAVFNPLTNALDLVPSLPDQISEGHRSRGFFLVVPDDEAADRRSFRIVSFCYDEYRVRVTVFSSATRKWQILPWSESVPTQPASGEYWLIPASGEYWLISGKQVNGFRCIVALYVWFRTPDTGGVDKWVIQNVLQLEEEVLEATEDSQDGVEQLKVLAIRDGIVYMTAFETVGGVTSPCWYLSFCLETRKLEKLFYLKLDGDEHPYFMPWPASLVEIEHPVEGEREKLGNDDDRGIITTLGASATKRLKAM